LLSTRPEKYAGTVSMWEEATGSLRHVLERLDLQYEVDPGEGVFYGPKIDIKLKDALGHVWQGPTIQVDFNLPRRFNVCYIGEDGLEYNVVMIHRTVLGSLSHRALWWCLPRVVIAGSNNNNSYSRSPCWLRT
jgi:threonyl-tRNA synthetase